MRLPKRAELAQAFKHRRTESRASVRPECRSRLQATLDTLEGGRLWLADPASIRWALGADTAVDRTARTAPVAIGFDGTDFSALAPTNEAARIREEVLPAEIPLEVFQWHEGTIETVLPTRIDPDEAVDVPIQGMKHVSPWRFRLPVGPHDIDPYRQLGTAVARAIEEALKAAQPADTERAVARSIRETLLTDDIWAPVVLVGGASRAREYRHPVPTSATLGDYAIASVTARREGLHASCTRTIAFEAPEWLEERHATAARVEGAALGATREAGRDGGRAGAVMQTIKEAYAAADWPDEWTAHHQGGATGYAGREWVATPGSDIPIETPAAYAWNPTVRGAKSEDTVLVTDSGFDVLTQTGDWPTRTIEVDGEPLDRPWPLQV
ncbi:MAG: M24 family metallopeptidase [Halobacteriaceae archaeon]